MSFLGFVETAWAKVEGIEHTVVSWLVEEYAVFYKHEPKIVAIVDQTVQYVEIGLPIVLGVTGGEALAPEIEAVLNEITGDLKVVSATVYDFGPSPDAAALLASVQANLASLETAGHVKNPLLLAKLKLIVNSVGALAQIILKAVDAAKGAPPATA